MEEGLSCVCFLSHRLVNHMQMSTDICSPAADCRIYTDTAALGRSACTVPSSVAQVGLDGPRHAGHHLADSRLGDTEGRPAMGFPVVNAALAEPSGQCCRG